MSSLDVPPLMNAVVTQPVGLLRWPPTISGFDDDQKPESHRAGSASARCDAR